MPGVARTLHPTHSVAVWGQDKAFYLDVGTSTFDHDSIFGKIHDRNAWLVSLGADIKFFTFIHFVEKQFGVPYRDDESLTGSVVHDGVSEDVTISFYKQRKNVLQQHQFFRDYLRQAGLVNVVRHGDGEVSAIRARTYFDEATRKLQSDTYYFSKKKSLKRLVRDRLRRLVGP
jgi:aminoglycoside 3-N-acetyltransferase